MSDAPDDSQKLLIKISRFASVDDLMEKDLTKVETSVMLPELEESDVFFNIRSVRTYTS